MIIGIGSDLCNIDRIQRSLDRFGDRFQGAMSHHAQALIAAAGYRISYERLHRQLGDALRAGQFEQDPQLEGSAAARRRQVFT